MSVDVESTSSSSKRAFLLLRTVDSLRQLPGGVNTAYGADQCNRLLDSAKEVASTSPEMLVLLNQLQPLEYEPGMAAWLVPEAGVLLAELRGILHGFIDLHMDPEERKRIGI